MSARALHHIASRISLRPPQAESLKRLARALEASPSLLSHERDAAAILSTLQAEFPTLTDFEREFPSLCFALATGVGKTRLMGAFIAYLHLAHGINNFFVLAPNLTIYNKLITDFTRNTPKYVFKGIAEFAQQPPLIITGDNYDQTGAAVDDQSMGFAHDVRINIFNISKINSEVRGGKEPRIKRMREVLGDSYFNHLANLPDLVLLMDESHRYRASAGVRAINELRPLFGLEGTATPFVESSKGPVPFKNVVMDYPQARAMEDGFVKEPAVVTQRNFKASDHTPEEVEKIKLEDGVRLHETTKVELTTYARENGVKMVKPFMLVIARDTTHAASLLALLESAQFYDGRYAGKVIQVDSSCTGAEEEEMGEREIVGQMLRTHEQFTLAAEIGLKARRPEDYIVHALADFDDIDYFTLADLLYELAGQMVRHLHSYLSETETMQVLERHRRLIAREIHAQMLAHFDEAATEFEVQVHRGFTALKPCTYTATAGLAPRHFRETVADVSAIRQMLFGGFKKCLYPLQKFDSDTERRFAVILERDAVKWFKPAKGQFQIYYKLGAEQPEYVPDFVVEMDAYVLMVEIKKRDDLQAAEVLAKAAAAARWCQYASDHAVSVGGKPWKYLLVPHDEIDEARRLADFMRFEAQR